MIADTNSDVLRQLTRIADALSEPGPSPWIEWTRTLSSFVAGVVLAYFSIFLQGTIGDRREQRKMRRIMYTELSDAIFWLHATIANMSAAMKIRKTVETETIKKGFIDPPSVRIVNPPWTFEGEEYMRNHHSVAYELPEREFFKRVYSQLHLFSADQTVPIGEFKSALKKISKEFKNDPLIGKGLQRFAQRDFKSLEAILNYYADHQIKPEELLSIMYREPSGEM